MAAPPKVTIDDLSGKYIMNHSLSDPIDPLLTLQGLSWFLRKAISLATVTLSVHQYRTPAAAAAAAASEADPSPAASEAQEPCQVVHIDITQVATGGISTTQENRVLDWREREHSDRIFGSVRGRSRMFELGKFEMVGPGGEGDRAFLRGEVGREDVRGDDDDDGVATGEGKTTGWLDESRGRHVQSWVRNVDETAAGGWTAEQVWGFEMIDAKRFYTRRVVVRKGEGRVERARLVYDYKGEVQGKDEGEVEGGVEW